MPSEIPAGLSRRTVLAAALGAAGLLVSRPLRSQVLLQNVTRLHSVRVARVVVPHDLPELAFEVNRWPGRICIGGGRFSMGGQIGIEGGLHIDMREMKRLVWLRPGDGCIRVQSGMRWRDMQDIIDPYGLSVRTMQSYSNFTIGGSVSVNAHGRYVGHGPVGESVRALQIMLADGSVVEANRQVNAELFAAAIGGYGGVGIVTEVELDLDPNSRMERSVMRMPRDAYPDFFLRQVRGSDCLMHNADLLPPHFEEATAISWRPTDKPLTIRERLIPRGESYGLERAAIWAVTELPGGDRMQRKVVRPGLLHGSAVVWRNHEASLDAASLEPANRDTSTYALQEYFVPPRLFQEFSRAMVEVLRRHHAQVLNNSLRHSPADRTSVMAWAREEVFCFVLYYKQRVDEEATAEVRRWTRELIDAAVKYEGAYYLPYQRHATQAQFDKAYPLKERFKQIKARVDPTGRMMNELWRQYL